MPDDAPPPLTPRLAISLDQAEAITARLAPRSSVLGITELHGGEISAVFEIALANAPSCVLKVYPASLQWKMAKEVLCWAFCALPVRPFPASSSPTRGRSSTSISS